MEPCMCCKGKGKFVDWIPDYEGIIRKSYLICDSCGGLGYFDESKWTDLKLLSLEHTSLAGYRSAQVLFKLRSGRIILAWLYKKFDTNIETITIIQDNKLVDLDVKVEDIIGWRSPHV